MNQTLEDTLDLVRSDLELNDLLPFNSIFLGERKKAGVTLFESVRKSIGIREEDSLYSYWNWIELEIFLKEFWSALDSAATLFSNRVTSIVAFASDESCTKDSIISVLDLVVFPKSLIAPTIRRRFNKSNSGLPNNGKLSWSCLVSLGRICSAKKSGFGDLFSSLVEVKRTNRELLIHLDEICLGLGVLEDVDGDDFDVTILNALSRAWVEENRRNEGKDAPRVSISEFLISVNEDANWSGLSDESVLRRLLALGPKVSQSQRRLIDEYSGDTDSKMSLEFATIDFETTGFQPKSDRVLEIGIVRTNFRGEIVQEFSSLIDPKRSPGPTHVHGISTEMLKDAPEFHEIAGHIAEILNGAVLVAHNAQFDVGFLISEFERSDRVFGQVDSLCTLKLMKSAFPTGARKLGDCCRQLGIEIDDAHTALGDARMASKLLHHLLDRDFGTRFPDRVDVELNPISRVEGLPRPEKVNHRFDEANYLSSLVSRLPNQIQPGGASASKVAQYLNLLDRILEDRRIDKSEADVLYNFAAQMELTKDVIQGVHAAYIAGLCSVALSDGIVTKDERIDLFAVAELLEVTEIDKLLNNALAVDAPVKTGSEALHPGMAVCFTGIRGTVDEKEFLEKSLAIGLIVKSGMSKKVDILVLGDSDSSSLKALKARELGTRIMTKDVFRRLLSASEQLPN